MFTVTQSITNGRMFALLREMGVPETRMLIEVGSKSPFCSVTVYNRNLPMTGSIIINVIPNGEMHVYPRTGLIKIPAPVSDNDGFPIYELRRILLNELTLIGYSPVGYSPIAPV